jgi:hypothetical protein
MKMGKFAETTTVSVEKSRAEIESLIVRYGATHTAFMSAPGRAVICFEAKARRIMFELPLPDKADKRFTHVKKGNSSYSTPRTPEAAHAAWEQGCRQRWRALALVIKAKLEAVESGITAFEDEFLAHIVMPDGQTVATHIKPRIAQAYEEQAMVPLLPAPGKLQ